MSVRLATMDDVPALVAMARHFIAYGPHGGMIDTTDDALAERAMVLLGSPGVVVFVGELNGKVSAMLVGALNQPWFAPHVVMASELAWWVEEHARMTPIAIRLVRAYEQWARNNGAKLIAMSALAMNNGPDVGSILTRLGYAKAESTYIKES